MVQGVALLSSLWLLLFAVSISVQENVYRQMWIQVPLLSSQRRDTPFPIPRFRYNPCCLLRKSPHLHRLNAPLRISNKIPGTTRHSPLAQISWSREWNTGSHFLGVTLGWEDLDMSKSVDDNQHEDGSLFPSLSQPAAVAVNLSHPTLIRLALPLAPCILRIGGALVRCILFYFTVTLFLSSSIPLTYFPFFRLHSKMRLSTRWTGISVTQNIV